MGMIELSENTKVGISLSLLVSIIVLTASAVWGYFQITQQIEEAKHLPAPGTGAYTKDLNDETARYTWPVTYMEYHMKDQIVREHIEELQTRVDELEEEVRKLRTGND